MREPFVKQIHKLLIKNGKTIAVAESCTGGSLSHLLTSQSGSSKYFILGVIPYSNKAKSKILKISAKLIAQKGAVSREVAEKMAQAVRKLAKADLGIGITGIAGPIGGTPQKPVGTVFIAVSHKDKTFCKKSHFTGTRASIRKKASLKALELILAKIESPRTKVQGFIPSRKNTKPFIPRAKAREFLRGIKS
jgi:PncC family amidohydrolase